MGGGVRGRGGAGGRKRPTPPHTHTLIPLSYLGPRGGGQGGHDGGDQDGAAHGAVFESGIFGASGFARVLERGAGLVHVEEGGGRVRVRGSVVPPLREAAADTG